MSDWHTIVSFLDWKGARVGDEESLALRDIAVAYKRTGMSGKWSFTHPIVIGSIECNGSSEIPLVRGTVFVAEIMTVSGQTTTTFVLPPAADECVVGPDSTVRFIEEFKDAKGRAQQKVRISRDPHNVFGRKGGESLN